MSLIPVQPPPSEGTAHLHPRQDELEGQGNLLSFWQPMGPDLTTVHSWKQKLGLLSMAFKDLVNCDKGLLAGYRMKNNELEEVHVDEVAKTCGKSVMSLLYEKVDGWKAPNNEHY
ncbi:hypothetical protein HDU76_009760, partial [Blyttiomyces sp. JEL0837]